MNITDAEFGSMVRMVDSADTQNHTLLEPTNVDPYSYRVSANAPHARVVMHARAHNLDRFESPRLRHKYGMTKIVPNETVERELSVYGH